MLQGDPRTLSRMACPYNQFRTLGKQNMYTLRSFDAASQAFNYDVNSNTGVVTPSGSPYQIQHGLRYGF